LFPPPNRYPTTTAPAEMYDDAYVNSFNLHNCRRTSPANCTLPATGQWTLTLASACLWPYRYDIVHTTVPISMYVVHTGLLTYIHRTKASSTQKRPRGTTRSGPLTTASNTLRSSHLMSPKVRDPAGKSIAYFLTASSPLTNDLSLQATRIERSSGCRV
jgi:hypothetical protein